VPQAIKPFYALNPIAHLIAAFRDAVVGRGPPDLVALTLLAVLGVVSVIVAQRIFSVFDGVLADVI
jgi:ABC-type polysaccharide/polyol phosphate export permease